MSSFGIRPNTKRINVDENFLPYPATKLVISQYLKSHPGRPAYWAWIIVGAFYDKDDNCLWSTEVFAAHLDVDPDYEPFQWSSEEESDSESEIESETGGVIEEQVNAGSDQGQQTSASPQLPPEPRFQPRFQQQQPSNSFSQRLPPHLVPFHQQQHPNPPPHYHFHPSPAQGYWNPSLYTAPPGNWVSAFDPRIGNWVNTWQPE